MTRRLIREPSRWETERADRRGREHRETVSAALSARLSPQLTDEQVVAFTGAPGTYVQSVAEARAHASVAGTSAVWVDADGGHLVEVDWRGNVVELGPGRWR